MKIWQTLKAVLHHLVLIRVPVALGLILITLAILGIVGPPATRSLVSGLHGIGLFLSALLVVLTAALVAHTGVLIWDRAPVRFHAHALKLPAPGKRRWLLQLGLVIFVAGPLVVLLMIKRADHRSWWPGILGALTAAVVVAGFVWLAIFLRRQFPETRIGKIVASTFASGSIHSFLGPGYSDRSVGSSSTNEAWRQGHFFSALLALVFVTLYGLVGSYSTPGDQGQLPALVFVLLLLMALGAVLPGATFFLDRYRIPLTLVVLVWVGGTELSCPRPHTVLIAAPTTPSAVSSSNGSSDTTETVEHWRLSGASPKQALVARAKFSKKPTPRVLTVVTAAGGGIQASAWTAQVLAGLQQGLGEEFTRSIYLMSAVSGGSTGTFLFTESIDPKTGAVPPSLLEEVIEKAMEPSLAETGWGLAFADVVRGLAPFLVGHDQLHRDRGWAMEQAWRQDGAWLRSAALGIDKESSSLQEWANAALKGELPGVIFGSTIVDDGQQALFSNLDLRDLGSSLRETFGCRSERAADPGLVRHFPEKTTKNSGTIISGCGADAQPPRGGPPNLPASTAARLSATFPWISPVARVDLGNGEDLKGPGYHFADGGYFDNFGVMAAVQWLRLLVSTSPELLTGYEQILFIEVNGFPYEPKEPPDPRSSGPLYSLLGPLRAILEVRTSSQIGRGLLELDLLAKNIDGMNLQRAEHKLDRLPHLRFFELRMPDSNGTSPPLSWMLSEKEKKNVRTAWDSLQESGQLCQLATSFAGKEGVPSGWCGKSAPQGTAKPAS